MDRRRGSLAPAAFPEEKWVLALRLPLFGGNI
jgi:hypothetical protein